MTNAQLAIALMTKTQFTNQEWSAFCVAEVDFSERSYVKSGSFYFQPMFEIFVETLTGSPPASCRGRPESVGSREGYTIRDVHDLLDEMDGICSVGNVQQQQEQLAALLGSILQFTQSVQKNSLKACVVVVTQMLVVLRGDGRSRQVTRDVWAIVQQNLCYMQVARNLALPTEISFAQNSMLNTVCKVFSHLPHCARRKIYKTMFDGMPNFSLRSMSKYLAAHKSTSTGGELQTVSEAVEQRDTQVVRGRKESSKPKPAPAETALDSEVVAGSSVPNTKRSKTQSAPPEPAVDK